MTISLPCVLMRAGTSRGPFFLRDWLPESDEARDQALIGAIGASDPLQLDGLGGGSTLHSKVNQANRIAILIICLLKWVWVISRSTHVRIVEICCLALRLSLLIKG